MEGRHTLLHLPVSTAALCPLGNHHQTEPSGRDSVLVISAAPGPDTGLDSGCCINGGLLDGGRLTWEVQYIIVNGLTLASEDLDKPKLCPLVTAGLQANLFTFLPLAYFITCKMR